MSIGALVLDGDTPHIRLEGRNAKNRKAAQIALRRDIAGDLRNYLAVRLAWLRSGYSGQPIPLQVPATAQLFENMQR